MIARRLQSLLGTLYDLEPRCDIAEFLVTDRLLLRDWQADQHRLCDEQLLMAETDDGARLSLFIDAAVLQRLEAHDPLHDLSERNLAEYCTALEGVSHFVYAAWRLHHDAPVSLLELETQAEVDKFAAAALLLSGQRGGDHPAYLFARLFEASRFDSRLQSHELHRYETAHRCAARYCRFLEHRFVSRGKTRIEALLRELRKFYRLRSRAKLDYAMGAA